MVSGVSNRIMSNVDQPDGGQNQMLICRFPANGQADIHNL